MCVVEKSGEAALVRQKGRVGRVSKTHGADEARLSVLVADPFQGLGIGKKLVRQMVLVASGEYMRRLVATLTPDNVVMQHIFQNWGFSLEPTADGKLQAAAMQL